MPIKSMICLVLIKYIVAAMEQPAARSICSACEKALLDSHAETLPGAVADPAGVRCPCCGIFFVHFECASKGLSQIKCRGCERTICCKSAELDELLERLCSGEMDAEDADIGRRALDDLKSIGNNLMLATLHSYDMTADELRLLNGIVGSAGTGYQGVMDVVNQIIGLKTIFSIHADEIVASLAGMQALDINLLILSAVITPNFIAEAKMGQIVALIRFLAGYGGASAGASGALAKKIIDLANAVGTVRADDDTIKELLSGLISSGNCAMIEHLIGRHRFGHRLTDDDVCAILEQYAASCAYDDEAFMPLFVFLVNGNISVMPSKHRLQRLFERVLQRNGGVAGGLVYTKLRRMVEKCRLSAASAKDVIAEHGSASKGIGEDFFCAIIRALHMRGTFACLMGQLQDARAAQIVRYIPFSWIRKNARICIDIAEQAIKQKKIAVLEETLPIFINTRQSPKSMRSFFENLLKSDLRDYASMALKIINYDKFYRLKNSGVTDWLQEQLVGYKLYWCLPYLRGHVAGKSRCEQAIAQHHREIMNTMMGREFQFSPSFCELLRYDAKNTVFVENLGEYFEMLLKASTDKHVIQRLLIEICATWTFTNTISMDRLAALYELFKMHRDCFFYLDALYYALRYTPHRNCLKALIMDDLEGSVARNRWAAASMKNGALQERRACKRCSNHKCTNFKCKHCKIVSGVAFGDLLAALRYTRASR